jgi:hypothetical protein
MKYFKKRKHTELEKCCSFSNEDIALKEISKGIKEFISKYNLRKLLGASVLPNFTQYLAL